MCGPGRGSSCLPNSYAFEGSDYNFDAEFAQDSLAARARLRLKNSVHRQALHAADAVYTPTRWQYSQFPAAYKHKISVIFDGIDTALVAPKQQARIHLKRDNLTLTAADEVITFVNRNLEPYRGFHVFMRALPEILKQRPKAHYQDYLSVIQNSSCHVYLTYPFVLSWSCLEVLSAGRVVVASNTGPVQEVIEHGVNGLLFDFFDAAALSTQVIDVLAQPENYRDLGRRARETVLERYDLKSKCLPQQLELIGGTRL